MTLTGSDGKNEHRQIQTRRRKLRRPRRVQMGRCEEFLQGHILGFCCCGVPQDSLRYVRDCLRHVANRDTVNKKRNTHKEGDEWDTAYQEWDKAGKELMGRAEYFTLYFLDQKVFTEHGSSVGGSWLSSKGKELLQDLDVRLFPLVPRRSQEGPGRHGLPSVTIFGAR